MQPYNYSIDPGNPQDSFMKGVQQSWGLQDREAQQQQVQAAQVQAQQQAQQQQQMQQDLYALSQKASPTSADYIAITTKYPQLSKQLKDTMASMSEEQKQSKINVATQVVSAINAGRSDLAKQILESQQEAARNSGNKQEEQGAELLAKIIDTSPESAKHSAIFSLSAMMGDKFAPVLDSMLKTPLEAQKLSIENVNAPIRQELENQNLLQDVESKKLKRQLDTLDAQIRTADSETKRGELKTKREQLNTEFSEKQTARVESAQTTLASVDNQLETVTKALNNPQLDSMLSAPGDFWYSVRKYSPISNDVKDMQALLDTVGSQQLLGNLMELKKIGGTMGALSKEEGVVLKSAKASLDTAQSAGAVKDALKTIRDSLLRVQRGVVASGVLPKDAKGVGGAFVMDHPKFGQINEAFINKILEKRPGATRDQVIKSLEGGSSGATGSY